MTPKRTPYPPPLLELDFDEIASGLRRAPAPDPPRRPSADARSTISPEYDVEAFAREAMSEPPPSGKSPAVPTKTARPANIPRNLPEPPDSDVRPVTDLAKTVPPPARDSKYPDKSDVRSALNPLAAEMQEYVASNDFKSALVLAEQILEDDPANLDAKEVQLRCHTALEELYIRRLGTLANVPAVAVTKKEIPNLALDHRSGFILALVDGVSTLDMILDMCSMRRLDALRVLNDLVQQGILRLS